MAGERRIRRGSTLGPVFLIALGLLILASNLIPDLDPWPWVAAYWPALIIAWGLYKLAAYFRLRGDPLAASTARITGGDIFLLIAIIVCGSLFTAAYRGNADWTYESPDLVVSEQAIERGEAENVDTRIEFEAGMLFVAGGTDKLVEGRFRTERTGSEPELDYSESDARGRLRVRQTGKRTVHFGDDSSRWDLLLNEEVPMTLRVHMGAGQATLELGTLRLSELDFEMGAGQAEIDLHGDWKNDFSAEIKGGVGRLRVRLPHNVGTRVRARGALGSIDVKGLQRRGDYYVNDLYDESEIQLDIEVKGAVGLIEIEG